MQKVAEVAEELGVTRQTVYNWIDRLGKKLESHIHTLDGAKALDVEGVEIIREAVGVKTGFKEDGEQGQGNGEGHGREDLLNEVLMDHIERLEAQLEEKDRQLERKDELLRNFQVITQRNQERIEELEGETEEREGWWDRLRKHFRKRSVW